MPITVVEGVEGLLSQRFDPALTAYAGGVEVADDPGRGIWARLVRWGNARASDGSADPGAKLSIALVVQITGCNSRARRDFLISGLDVQPVLGAFTAVSPTHRRPMSRSRAIEAGHAGLYVHSEAGVGGASRASSMGTCGSAQVRQVPSGAGADRIDKVRHTPSAGLSDLG